MTKISQQQHLNYLKQTLELASQSPPKPTNFRVGCVIVSFQNSALPRILSTGYTLELPGNTHAEQCAIAKLAQEHKVTEETVSTHLPPEANTILYTSLEPCGKRLSGNLPCVQRIIATRKNNPNGGIRKVVFGAKEPGTFVEDSQSCKILTEAGVEWEYLSNFENEILQVAMEGHQSTPGAVDSKLESLNQGNTSSQRQPEHSSSADSQRTADDLPKRGDDQPRNPKKRMMEVPLPDDSSSK